MTDFNKNLMLKLKGIIEAQNFECIMNIPEEYPEEVSMRFALERMGENKNRTVLAEFYCPPADEIQNEDNPVSVFSIILTIAEEFPAENINELNSACMKLNVMENGGAMITSDEPTALFCRTDLVLRHEYDMDSCINMIVDSMAMVINYVDNYCETLVEIAYKNS